MSASANTNSLDTHFKVDSLRDPDCNWKGEYDKTSHESDAAMSSFHDALKYIQRVLSEGDTLPESLQKLTSLVDRLNSVQENHEGMKKVCYESCNDRTAMGPLFFDNATKELKGLVKATSEASNDLNGLIEADIEAGNKRWNEVPSNVPPTSLGYVKDSEKDLLKEESRFISLTFQGKEMRFGNLDTFLGHVVENGNTVLAAYETFRGLAEKRGRPRREEVTEINEPSQAD